MAGHVIHILALAHHRGDEIHRCVLIPWGQRHLALCARCLAFYPALFGALTVQIAARLRLTGPWDWGLVLFGVAIGLFDWGCGRLGWTRGNNVIRMATGALSGLAAGRALYIYFRDPLSEVFWVTTLVVVIVALAVEIVRALGLRDLP